MPHCSRYTCNLIESATNCFVYHVRILRNNSAVTDHCWEKNSNNNNKQWALCGTVDHAQNLGHSETLEEKRTLSCYSQRWGSKVTKKTKPTKSISSTKERNFYTTCHPTYSLILVAKTSPTLRVQCTSVYYVNLGYEIRRCKNRPKHKRMWEQRYASKKERERNDPAQIQGYSAAENTLRTRQDESGNHRQPSPILSALSLPLACSLALPFSVSLFVLILPRHPANGLTPTPLHPRHHTHPAPTLLYHTQAGWQLALCTANQNSSIRENLVPYVPLHHHITLQPIYAVRHFNNNTRHTHTHTHTHQAHATWHHRESRDNNTKLCSKFKCLYFKVNLPSLNQTHYWYY